MGDAGGAARTSFFRTGADFEAGRGQHRNEPMPGVEVEAAGDSPGGQWTGGHDNFRQVDGRQKRLRPTLPSKEVEDPRLSRAGQKLAVF